MQEIYEDEATRAALNRLKKIRVWHEIGDNFTSEDKAQVLRDHKERMGR